MAVCPPTHTQQEFAGLGGAKGIALQKHAKPYSAATHNELGVVLWHRWGKVAICNKKVMEWALCLLTITGVTTACLFNPYDFHVGHPSFSLTPPLRCSHAQVVP